jgi:hypothetical protein
MGTSDGSMARWLDGSMARWLDGSMAGSTARSMWLDGSMLTEDVFSLDGLDARLDAGLDAKLDAGSMRGSMQARCRLDAGSMPRGRGSDTWDVHVGTWQVTLTHR